MKFGFKHIIISHIDTLRDASTRSIRLTDLFFFYIFPFIFILPVFFFKITVGEVVLSVSISIFAIFIALMLSVQMAIYSIFRGGPKSSDDEITKELYNDRWNAELSLLRELNSNISYLILICVLYVTVFLCFIIFNFLNIFEAVVLFIFYTHFLLNLLMVIRRSHAIFFTQYN